jgi:hypothetical protein
MTTPTTTDPVIQYYNEADNYSSVWIKHIEAVDLGVHCINSLIGPRHWAVDNKARQQTITLNEHPDIPLFYLCGVTYPYRWAANAHLLGCHTPGTDPINYKTGNLLLTLHNITPIEIHPHAIDPSDPHADERLYNTCRNWQAAWILHTRWNLANRVNPDRYKYARRKKKPATTTPETTEPPTLF